MGILPSPIYPNFLLFRSLLIISAIHFVTFGLINFRNTVAIVSFWPRYKKEYHRQKMLNTIYMHRSMPTLYFIIYRYYPKSCNNIFYTYGLERNIQYWPVPLLKKMCYFDLFHNSYNLRNVTEMLMLKWYIICVTKKLLLLVYTLSYKVMFHFNIFFSPLIVYIV